jgi:uncharacterized DUF497 family protein
VLFAWDDWNIEHLSLHAVSPRDAEFVVENAEAPYPQQKGDDKLLVWGPTQDGRLLQVIFALKTADEVSFDSLTIDQWAELNPGALIIYVVHAMDLTDQMKRIYRRRRR